VSTSGTSCSSTCRAFGASENTEHHLDAAAVGAMLRALVRDLGWSEIRLVGHSMGGFLAAGQWPAATRPGNRVRWRSCPARTSRSSTSSRRPFRSLIAHTSAALAYLSLVVVAKGWVPFGTALLRAADAVHLMPLAAPAHGGAS